MENYEWLRRTAKETEIHDFIDVSGNGPSGNGSEWERALAGLRMSDNSDEPTWDCVSVSGDGPSWIH